MMDCAEKIENDIKNMSMYVSVSHLFCQKSRKKRCGEVFKSLEREIDYFISLSS